MKSELKNISTNLFILLCFFQLPLLIIAQNSPSTYDFAAENSKRNLIGFDAGIGVGGIQNRKGLLSYSLQINYARVSKRNGWWIEIGARYLQLRGKSDKFYEHSSIDKDTFYVNNEDYLFFELPLSFKRIIPLRKNTNMILNFSLFYSSYIEHYRTTRAYLSADNREIGFARKKMNPNNFIKMGLETGIGIAQKLNDKTVLFATIGGNIRFEFDIFEDIISYPNVTIGLRRFF